MQNRDHSSLGGISVSRSRVRATALANLNAALRTAGFPAAILIAAVVLAALLAAPPVSIRAAAAQEAKAAEKPKSSAAAVRGYRAAVAFQKREVYDLAIDEWQNFLEKYADDPLAPKARYYLGVCQFALGKYPEAEKTFTEVVEKHPDIELLGEAYANLGLAQYNQTSKESRERTVVTLGQLLEKFPDGKHAPLAWYYRAEARYGLGKRTEAVSDYRQLLEKFPKDARRPDALYGLGVALEELNKPAEAGEVYDTFLKESPGHGLATEVGMRRGETLLAQGDYAAAEARFATAAAAAGFELADYALLRQAVCRYEQQKHVEAAQLFGNLVERFPKSARVDEATLSAGKCYYLAGDQQQARAWLGKARQAKGETRLDAAHWLARSYLSDPGEGKAGDALAAVDEALPAAREAKGEILAELLLDQADAMYELPDKQAAAVEAYGRLAAEHPESRVAPQASYMAAFSALTVGEHEEALKQTEAFEKRFKSNDLAADVQYVAAEANLQLGRHEKAAEQFGELVAKYPARGEKETWQVRRGLCLHLAKKHDDVIAQLGPLVASLKDPIQAAEAQFLLGNSHFEKKNYPAAIAALEAAVASGGKWRRQDESLLLLARAKRGGGDAKSAMADVDRLIAEYPDSKLLDRAHFRRGEMLTEREEWSDAAAAYEKVVAGWPQSSLVPHALFGLGWAHLNRGQSKPAEVHFTRLIENHSDHTLALPARYARATARQQTGNFSAAAEDVTAFLSGGAKGTERSDALFVRGLCEAGLKQHDKAAASYREILENSPKYAAADKVLYELAWADQEQDRVDAAVETFARLAREFPKSPLSAEAHYRVGEHRYGKQAFSEAAEAYGASVAAGGEGELAEKAIHKLGWSRFKLDDYAAAHETFAEQVKKFSKGPLAADGRVMAAESLFQQKQYEAALAAFAEARGSNPPPAGESMRVISLLHAGQSAGQLEKWEESLALLEECGTKFPESDYHDEVRYELAWAKQNLGKSDEALEVFRAVAETNDDNVLGARARFMEGEILFQKSAASKDAEQRDALAKDAIRSFFLVAYGFGDTKAPKPFHVWQANATFEAARCLESVGKPDAAKRLFAELIERYPKSDKVSAARKKLAALGG